MKKVIFIVFLLLTTTVFGASEPATKDDIKMLVELIKANQESTDKRFDDSNKRFDDVNSRFEEAHNLSMAIIAGIFGFIGFSLWDRRTMISRTKEETITIIEKELSQKADRSTLEKVVSIIEDMAKKDESVREILARHHLKMV